MQSSLYYWLSHDQQFRVVGLTQSQFKAFRSRLADYYDYMIDRAGDTLLPKFCGTRSCTHALRMHLQRTCTRAEFACLPDCLLFALHESAVPSSPVGFFVMRG